MATLIPWFERVFRFDVPDAVFPNVLERLRGAPARLEERLGPLSGEVLVRKPDGTWSIQENAGHLADLEPLWAARVQDFVQGHERLQVADLTNRRTHEAHHNEAPVAAVLGTFRSARQALVRTLQGLDPTAFSKTALHPRLGTPMRLIDHMLFVAEHDDHHLARITQLLGADGL